MVRTMHNPAAEALAKAAVALRKNAGLNQRQLAAKLGREQNYVARVETAQRRLDLLDWVALCGACGVDPETEIRRLVRLASSLLPAGRSEVRRKRRGSRVT
jgi:transcriptional regulator with XRE-family HTH domain